MTLHKIIARAKRMGRVKSGLVLCDLCDTPASKEYSMMLSWTGCAPCVTGESGEFDSEDLIALAEASQ